MYDITSEKSFDSIRNWIRNIEEHASSDVERMLVGNKCDMNDKRQVSKERGEKVLLSKKNFKFLKCLKIFIFIFKLALEYGMKCIETSAKANINIENAFITLARDIKTKTERRQNVIFFIETFILPSILF